MGWFRGLAPSGVWVSRLRSGAAAGLQHIGFINMAFGRWLSGLVLLACMAPALAATTTPSPRLDYCWTDGYSQGNSNPDLYGTPYLAGNCYSTVNDFYDAMVSTIQQHYDAAWPQGKTWRCDFGACYGITYVTFSTFSKHAGGALAGQGQYNNCLEPSSPAATNNTAYCGLKRTDTTTGSDGSVQVSDVNDADLHTYVKFSCQDSRLIKTGPNTTAGVCANIVDVYSGLQDCPACQGRLSGSGSITPMTGAKTEVVPTEVSIGGQPLYLTYDTLRQMTAKADGLTSAAQLKDLPSFGPLWSSSFHKRLNIKAGSAGLEAYRGSGRITSFGLAGGAYVANAGINDTVTVAGGGYHFFDSASGVLETYNSAGQLTSSVDRKGNTLTYSYSTAAGAAAPAAGYLTQVSDNMGRAISFGYTLPVGGVATSDGLISTITAPDGRTITAAYDGAKNLSSLTWQDGKTRTFQYENTGLPWALTGKTDENNVRLATWAYDTAGRAISSDGALGTNHYSATYATPPQAVVTETLVGNTYYRTHTWQAPTGLQVTDATGTTSTTNVVMPNGYPVLAGISQPAGSGSPATSNASTYDARGNLLSHDNFQGVRSCYAYDGKNQEVTRVEGLANTVDCATVLPTTATLPAGARKYTTTWDNNWRVPKQTTQAGSVTTLVYQGQPDPKNGGAAASCSPAAALANGVPLNLLCKSVVEMASGAYFDNPSAASSDALIDKVVLLLHGEDGNGSPVLADSSTYRKNQTGRAGSASATSAHSKFGGGSINLDSTTSGGAFGFGPDNTLKLTGDFTIETFVKLNAPINSDRIIFGWGGDTSSGNASGRVAVDSTGKLNAYWAESYWANNRSITGPVITAGVWHHVALSRSNGNWIMHLDGVQAGAVVNHNNSDAFSYGRFELGRQVFNGGGSLNGYLDEVRITNGAIRYWGSFTPPTQQFGDPLDLNPAQPKVADTHYAKNILLLHADGAHGSKVVIDSSPRAGTGTLIRNAQISTTESKFGGSSIYIPGSTDYGDLGIVPGDYSLPGDFTVEFWMKPASTTANTIAVRLGNNAVYDDLYFGSNRLVLQSSSGPACIFGGNLAGLANTWIHVAYVRIGGTIYSYINGQGNGNCNWTAAVGNANGMMFGYNNTSNAVYYDDIRITKGQARYTGTFIPSAYPAPNVASVPVDASVVTTQYTYDAAGRVLTAKDTLNRTTTYAYYTAAAFSGTAPNETGHAAGDLQTITNPAGHVTQFTLYDRAGRVRQMVDPKGVVTDMVYTPRGWTSSVTVTPPGGTARTTTYTYDNAGQLTGATLPDGTSLGYSYDAAHRLTGVTDAKGNTITYTLDNAGNKTGEQVKDPSGNLQRNITRVYDALNRVQQITGASN
ncbi:YD repeat-containing protein [Polaromonas sp. JS666]|nr:YD repeat-containing protein [Polaromonas sp. JS666]